MRLGIAGASDNTGNLGVTALLYAIVRQLHERVPGLELVVFDSGIGGARGVVDYPSGPVEFERVAAKLTRKLHRPESFHNILVSLRLGRTTTPIIGYRSCSAVLDITGGDSYSDIYGQRRFRAARLSKAAILAAGARLILPPQTYGPYRRPANRAAAAGQVMASAAAFARDGNSFAVLRALLGDSFDEARHQRGVDVAFGLPAKEPANRPAWSDDWFGGDVTVVGVNVSGLLAGEQGARLNVGAGYQPVVLGLVRELLASPDVRVMLVPHVFGPHESDLTACEAVRQVLADERVQLIPETRDPMVAKWWISHCEWFTGARMHSTIAALSSGRPAAAMAYSDKFRGVFDDVGLGDAVVDLRRLPSVQAGVEQLVGLYEHRERDRRQLAAKLPDVQATLAHQFDEMVLLSTSP